MKEVYDIEMRVIDINNYKNGEKYFCIHCSEEMKIAAEGSTKITPYFRVCRHHKEECPAKKIPVSGKLVDRNFDINKLFNNLCKDKSSVKSKKINTEYKERRNYESKICSLSTLIEFCVHNNHEKEVNGVKISDFFVDNRTENKHSTLVKDNVYLLHARFLKYEKSKITFKYPFNNALYKIDCYLNENNFKKVLYKIFQYREEHRSYPQIYIIGKISSNGNIEITSTRQIKLV